MVKIVRVENEGDELDEIRMLFKEYLQELNENLCFQSFDEEVEAPLKKYGPEKGSLFIAYFGDEPAGCIALQPLKKAGVCEMKRLYVKPAFRKHGIGDELVKVLINDAKVKGYETMVLDTLERLQPAIKLYQRHGFKITSGYYDNPLANVVFMEKVL